MEWCRTSNGSGLFIGVNADTGFCQRSELQKCWWPGCWKSYRYIRVLFAVTRKLPHFLLCGSEYDVGRKQRGVSLGFSSLLELIAAPCKCFKPLICVPTLDKLVPKLDVIHMNRTGHRGRGFAMFCLWTVAGVLLGVGTAYFIYARQPPLFESAATLRLRRVEREESDKSAERDDAQRSQQGSENDTDVEVADVANPISGFRMTDDATEDVVIRDSVETHTDAKIADAGTERGFDSTEKVSKQQLTDDSLLLCSQAVLERAVELGDLDKLQELQWMVSARDKSPEAFVRAWVNDGTLKVEKAGESSLGGVYRITFRSRLPSISEAVVKAVEEAALERFDHGNLQEQQARFLELLISSRTEIDRRIGELENRCKELPEVAGAVLRDGKVSSPDAVRLNTIIEQFDRLQSLRDGLKQNLVRAEALLNEGASRQIVLKALGAPPPQPQIASQPEVQRPAVPQSQTSAMASAAEEYRTWLEMRNNLIEKVEREVEPMQKKLDALIEKKYGPNHPGVSHRRGKIGRVRAQLANLPPEPSGVGIITPKPNQSPDTSVAANSEDPVEIAKTEETALDSLLQAVRSELREVSDEVERLEPELETLSTAVAFQTKLLRQRQSVELEIQQQQSLREALINQMNKLSQSAVSSGISCELLVSAGAGVQVAPDLTAHLTAGGILGGASGAVLFLLIVLSLTAVSVDVDAQKDACR